MTETARRTLGALATTAYALAIVTANYLTSRYSFIPVGFGLTATAGTYSAGCAIMLRNQVQDLLGRRFVFAAILLGAVLSALTSPSLALASGTAFAIGELADMALYTPLRRHGWARAVIPASLLGSIVDTLAFLALASFPITGRSVLGQLIAKAWAWWVPVLIVTAYRSVRRDPVARNTVNA